MESSLININSASLEELQTINGIGPRLASRIIDFRDKSGAVVVKEQLIAVRGLGRKQIDQMAPAIDWSTNGQGIHTGRTSPIPAFVTSMAILAIIALLVYPMVGLFMEEFTHWEDNALHWLTTAVNLLAILFTSSTLILMLGWLLSIFYTRSSTPGKIIRYSAAAATILLILLVVISLIGHWSLNIYTDVTLYMLDLTVIVGSVVLLVYLQFGPQLLCLTRYHLNLLASRFFDYSLFPIAAAILLTAMLEPSKSPVVDIFVTWLGMLMCAYGLTLSRGRSCYADLMHDIYKWPNILQNDPEMAVNLSSTIEEIDSARSQQDETVVLGWATIVVGAATALYGIYELTITVLP
jgi:competence ComEA-like helix-hairpin-helix protein